MKEISPKRQALKSNATFFVAFLAVSIVLIVLGIVLVGDWTFILLLLGIGCLIGSFYYFINGIIRINRSFCPECSTFYVYDKYDIQWDEIKQTIVDNKLISTIKFECVCPKCKHKTVFYKTFRRMSYDKTTDKCTDHDIYALAKKIFWDGDSVQ